MVNEKKFVKTFREDLSYFQSINYGLDNVLSGWKILLAIPLRKVSGSIYAVASPSDDFILAFEQYCTLVTS